MKKPVKIALIVGAIAVAVAVVVGVVFANLIREKTPISAADFRTTMTDKGYRVQDAKKQFAKYDYVKEAYIAQSKDEDYQIEFYVLENDTYAISFYNNNKAIFESSKGNVSASKSIDISNYAKYSLLTDGKYDAISRIANTVLYSDADEKYKDTIKSVFEELGY